MLYDFTLAGGASRPIYNYYKHQQESAGKRMVLLRLFTRRSFLKLWYYGFLSERIIINGLPCFNYWQVLLLCVLKRGVVIYLHEAAPHVEPFAQRHALKFKAFCWMLRNRKVAFVSEWQRHYFLKWTTVPRYKIVYNNINFPYEQKAEKGKITIAMVGYQSRYKNAGFFSKVADEAVNRYLPYEFIWIGGEGGEMSQMYHSPNVRWLGDLEHVMDALNSIDILFFTSYGDTFGLVITEALYKGKKVVSFIENGLAPFVSKLKGCRVYEQFDESLVLELIDQVLKEEVNVKEHRDLVEHLCSMDNFKSRLEELFAMPDE
ncbi:glycosyltransferase [Flavisolibacter tropicus]|uniref:glycosyltransferase n=1 Tax=Flavisolibacter tropicus TaxID=1492898 RepID=UPI0013147C9D|nr:glycosyltransferase [Flavisolibacter tropicus]